MVRLRQVSFACAFATGLVLCTVAASEVAIRLAARVWRRADCATRPCGSIVIDPTTLATRGDPGWPEHDARGFRNARALTRSDVVTLGDSHTYGVHVQSDQAWPAQLRRRLNVTTYNMAVPATGPVQARDLLAQALHLHPHLVIFGFYFGNDLVDDFEAVRKRHRLSDFTRSDTVALIESAERNLAIEAEIGTRSPFVGSVDGTDSMAASATSSFRRLKEWLGDHSRLYGFLRSLRDRLASGPKPAGTVVARYEDAVAGLTDSQMPKVSAFSDGVWKTILTAPYRLVTLDQSDMRIHIGLTITEREIATMHDSVVASGAKFLVVLLPTKEFVFQDRIHDADARPGFGELVQAESEATRLLVAFFQANRIDFVDPSLALRTSAAQPYFEDVDGHPNAVGHAIIATAIADHLSAAR